jgi:hypothetical protein
MRLPSSWLMTFPQVERCVQGMSKEELQAKVHSTPTFQMLAGEQHPQQVDTIHGGNAFAQGNTHLPLRLQCIP